jgi:hypothetical protein
MPDLVPDDPRLPWVQPSWLAAVTDWISSRLEERGLRATDAIEQPHVRWWSTVLRVPTTDGDLWFKANAAPHAFEAALVTMLAHVCPERVPELVAADPDRGWLLMRDGGTRLREFVCSREDLHHWEKALPAYAELQLAVAPRVDELLGVGVPDEPLALLPDHLNRLLDDGDFLLLDLPGGVTSEERSRLRALLPELRAACDRLTEHGIPETIQHDDFHDGNVFVRDGRYVVFDWGDSCVSHPLHSLVVAMRAIAHRLELPPGGPDLIHLLDAYLEPFSGYGSRDELREAADLALFTGTAARTVAWDRFLWAREPEFRADDIERVPYGLKLLLQRGPVGSWS